MQISFFLAKRYIKQHGNTRLLHRLSRLSCCSMALGTAVLVLVLATMNGMEKLLSTLFYTYTPALKVVPKTGKTFVYDSKLKQNIIDLAGVTDVVEVLEATALVQLHRRQSIATIKGVSCNFTGTDLYKNCTHIDAATFLADGSPQATAGIGIARSLQWAPHNNRVAVFYPKQGGYHLHNPYKRMTLVVGGLFSIAKQIDSKYIIAPIHFVEALTDGLNQRTYWEVVIKDETDLKSTQAAIDKLLPAGYKVINRDEQNEIRRKAIFIERLSVGFIFILVLLLASLHIFFMLCMLILQKQKDIAILVSLGATPHQVGKIFFYHAILVSLKGMLYGMIIAWGVAFLQQKFSLITFTRGGHTTPYPIAMHGLDCLYTVIATTLFSLLASLWPVRRAMQLAAVGSTNGTTNP
ncbi:MAG: FtsX-like permease family protein [Candidatus Cardinium sp.]|uniref:ABC transporter permease n=1 Tax=Cardinium endosymbiont of Dermatophagoides farinae TaxID=2597823 RepID=UPI00118261B0|nr:FtsX-like permease family protein [Cardinium endosymbiont of Dermatophagoides farinae]TSJ81031.1 ABC transporter permease [Cardinium endosymbiont of Dermatophagoides farinae]UWW97058.1 MAG: FtsX-like permease family protein [Candidatus Cardinium sp.]